MSYSQGHLTAARVRLEAWQPPSMPDEPLLPPITCGALRLKVNQWSDLNLFTPQHVLFTGASHCCACSAGGVAAAQHARRAAVTLYYLRRAASSG